MTESTGDQPFGHSSNLSTSILENRRVRYSLSTQDIISTYFYYCPFCSCFSNVSTSSDWSWPTHHEDPRGAGKEGHDGDGVDGGGGDGMLEVGKDGSRRYSHLPPAKVKLESSIFILEISWKYFR